MVDIFLLSVCVPVEAFFLSGAHDVCLFWPGSVHQSVSALIK